MSSLKTTSSIGLTAKITAEMLLGKIRLSSRQREPSYLMGIRGLALQLKKSLGDEAYEGFSDNLKPVFHVMADAIFDEVTDIKRTETVEALKDLPIPQRLFVEAIVNRLTGKTDEHHRWDDDLHRLRMSLRQMADLSISGITLLEIREGYNELLHSIIDELWKHRATLVS